MSLFNIEPDIFAPAVRFFWKTRQAQGRAQKERGVTDQGKRSVVTGGRQLDGFLQIIANLLMDNGVKKEEICTRGHDLYLPGYFRPHKQWDMLVVREERLLAVLEFKSIASSFGNNMNNRSEEALGNAEDLWTAYREELLGGTQDPWFGFLMLMKDDPAVHKPRRCLGNLYDCDEVFEGGGYAKRAELLLRRLVYERKYSSACLLLSDGEDIEREDNYTEPAEDLSAANFLESLLRKVVP